MLEHCLAPELDVNSMIWQQDEPSTLYRDVTRYLKQTLPRRWRSWRLHSVATQITHVLFKLGFVEDNVLMPPMPVDLHELHDRIISAVALADDTFLKKLYGKLEYRPCVCRITRDRHVNT
jgi:hypothetical protein